MNPTCDQVDFDVCIGSKIAYLRTYSRVDGKNGSHLTSEKLNEMSDHLLWIRKDEWFSTYWQGFAIPNLSLWEALENGFVIRLQADSDKSKHENLTDRSFNKSTH